MMVQELIGILQDFDPAMEIAIGSNDEGQVYVGHDVEVEVWTDRQTGQIYVVIAS